MNPYMYFQGSDNDVEKHFITNAKTQDEKGMYPLHTAVKDKKRLTIVVAVIKAYPGNYFIAPNV